MRTTVAHIASPLNQPAIGPEILACLAMDLRSPLTMIHGHLEALQSSMVKGTHTLHRSLRVMEKHTRRMARVLDDLAIYCSLHQERDLAEWQCFSLRHCINDVLEQLAPLIELRQLTIDVSLPTLCDIKGNRLCWDTLFRVLIERTIYGADSGPVAVKITGEWSSTDAKIIVSDNGPGIPEDEVAYIFGAAPHSSDGYLRLDSHCSVVGLALVAKAAWHQGGKLTVSSHRHGPTVFTFEVPIIGPSASKLSQ
jgi:two-component system, OmpR family, phosphate regulon sensor histidine kinase PhoR